MQQMMEQSSELLSGNNLSLSTINNNSADADEATIKVVNLNDAVANSEQVSGTNEDTFEEEEDDSQEEEEEEENAESIVRDIINASMWTRKDIVTFKDSITTEGGDGILKVGHGEIATIRVPTHENGNCIFWEFATDSYDIGFGLLFEWNATPDNQVSIHISESEDEEDEEGMLGTNL